MTTPSSPPESAPFPFRRVLAGLCFFAFFPFLFADFFWDDQLVIRPDGPIASLSTLRIAFFGTCVLFAPEYDYQYYRPLIDSLFILEYAIAGMNPLLYHTTNFLLHLANALLAFGLLTRLFSTEAIRLPWVAFIGAGIFALHPIQVESVLWPAARPAILSLFFLLLGLHALCRMDRALSPTKAIGFAALTLLGLLGGLLSKEVAVTFVPLALLFLLEKGRRPSLAQAITAVGSVSILVIYLAMNSSTSGGLGAIVRQGLPYVFGVVGMFGFYVSKLLFPLELHPAYSPELRLEPLALGLGAISSLALVALALYGLWRRDRFGILVAVGAIQLGGSSVLNALGGFHLIADRYVYQGMLGLAILFTALALRLPVIPKPKALLIAFFLLAALSLRQSILWISEPMLWGHTLTSDPKNVSATMAFGKVAFDRGDFQTARDFYSAVAFEEREAPPGVMYGMVLRLVQAEIATGNIDGADLALGRLRTLSEQDGEPEIFEAIIALERGNLQRANELLTAAKSLLLSSPDGALSFNAAMLTLRLGGDPKEAAVWYQRALDNGFARSENFEQQLAAAAAANSQPPAPTAP
jgi:hypothetical protein